MEDGVERAEMEESCGSCDRAMLAAIEEGEKRGKLDGVALNEEEEENAEAGEGVEKAESEPSAATGLTPLG
jgi:hypothetical protein